MNKCLLVLALLAPTIVTAQSTDQVSPPPATLLPLKTPARFAWERAAYPIAMAAQFAASNSKPLAPESVRQEGRKVDDQIVAVPVTVQGTKENGKSREVYRWSDGRLTEKWLLTNFILEQQVDGTVAVIDPRLHPGVAAARSGTAFSELSWLRPTYYRGVQTVQGRQCYYYQGKPVGEINPESSEVTSDYSAWIEVQSGLPVASTDGDSLWLYKKMEASLPEPSPLFRTAIEQAEKRYQRVAGRFKPVKI